MMVLAQIPDPTTVIDTARGYSWEAGVLAFLIVTFIIGAGTTIWKLGWYAVHKTFGNEEKGTRGILGEFVDAEKKEKEANTLALMQVASQIENQQEQCGEHVLCIKALTDSVRADQETAQEGVKRLSRLVELHESQGDIGRATKTLTASHADLQNFKQAVCQHCDMCEQVCAKEFPNSAELVARHAAEIKRIIGEA